MLAEPAAPYPGPTRALWPMVLLFWSAVLYSIDKGIVGVLAEPIRAELGLSLGQMGLLLGLAYVLLSGVLGLGLGYLVDRAGRIKLLAGCILLWSLATIACGFAESFRSLFVFRMLVGLGEAGLAPAAVSLIADYFSPGQRGRALSAYLIGASVGSGLSSILPGWIVGQNWQVFGLLPWRSAFVVCGSLGPVVALLLLGMKEPPRRQAQGETSLLRLNEKTGWLIARRRQIAPLFAGFCLFYIALIGITAWTAAFLARRYGVSLPQFSGTLGLMLFASGMGGYLLSGIIVDSPIGRGSRGKLTILAILPIFALPSAFATFAPNPSAAIALLAAIGLAMPAVNIATNAAIQDLMPNTIRGFTHTLLGLCSALVAGATAPWLMATVSADLGQAFILVGVPALLASCLSFLFALRTLESQS